MERQPIISPPERLPKTIRIRARVPTGSLSPRGIVGRLLWAFAASGRRPSFEDYWAARGAGSCQGNESDREIFERLCQETDPDPVFSLRDHLFCPQFRDKKGDLYQILRISRSRIDLVREDGTTGTTTPGEFDLCFFPVEETPIDRTPPLQTRDATAQPIDRYRDKEPQ